MLRSPKRKLREIALSILGPHSLGSRFGLSVKPADAKPAGFSQPVEPIRPIPEMVAADVAARAGTRCAADDRPDGRNRPGYRDP
ncbi:MAG: hypothetical protein EBS83_02810 [Planctomycetia bacterium]|nr:hypothetical protein [Planctomycetia bacterium]